MTRTLSSLLLLSFLLSNAIGGSTGKIAGVVKDKKTGDPIFGANVRVEGTTLGGSADFQGKYFIINVLPNEYTLEVTMLGYSPVKVTGVQVRGDLTTTVNVELSETELQVTQEVVIVAERPLVQKDLTATTAIVSGNEIAALPVTEVGQVISMQAGFVQGSLRGGRTGEVAYWIDGVPVMDAYDGTQIVEVNKSLVQELQVISGAFNAEYGQAMSGIVNISSKEGSEKYAGGVGFYGGDYMPSDTKIFTGDKFKATDIRDFEGNLSGPLFTNRLTFFINARNIYFNGHEKGIRRFNPWNQVKDTSITRPLASGESTTIDTVLSEVPYGTGDNAVVPMDWSDRSYAQGKLTWHITPTMKLSGDYIFDYTKSKKYDAITGNDFIYFYDPDGKGNEYNKTNTFIFQFNHALSANTFYNIGGSFFKKDYKYYLYDLKYKDSTTAQGDHIQVEVVDPYGPHYVNPQLTVAPAYSFYTGGTDLNRSHRTTQTALIKFDINSQIDDVNMIKFGVEYRSHTLTNESMTLIPADDQSGFDYQKVPQSISYMRTEIADITSPYHDYYIHHPKEFSTYLQDKMEFKSIIVNIGLRFDYFNPDGQVLNDSHADTSDPLHYMYTVDDPSIDNPIRPDHIFNNNGTLTTLQDRLAYWYKPAKAKWAVSPRLGVSFPITDRGIIHFSYGHFFQIPRFEYLYENPRFKLSQVTSDNMGNVGNANLDPELTVSAELGLQQQLTDDIAFDLTAYMRDIRGLTGTEGSDIHVFGGGEYYQYTNSDFGIVKGIVFTLDKRFSNRVTARVDYTFQVASGTASDPQQARTAKAGGSLPDVEMVPLKWDQRHTLNVSVNYFTDTWGASSILTYGSGAPYTPSLEYSGTVTTMVTNSQNEPATFNCDLRTFYQIDFKPVKAVIFAQIYNLFDTRNQTRVYPSTGRSDYSLDEKQALTTPLYVNTAGQWFNDPTRYLEPRRIEFGINLEF